MGLLHSNEIQGPLELNSPIVFIRRNSGPISVQLYGPTDYECKVVSVFFIFVFFKKKLQKYIFGFRFYSSIPLPPRSGATRSRPSGSGAAGVYFCKFRKQKYIFVKNENKK